MQKGVLSSVKGSPAADRLLPSAGRETGISASLTRNPLLPTSHLPAGRKLQPRATEKQAGMIMLHVGALQRWSCVLLNRTQQSTSSMLCCQQYLRIAAERCACYLGTQHFRDIS